jgi:hypothetical protein
VPHRNLLLVGVAASFTVAAALYYFQDTPDARRETARAHQPGIFSKGNTSGIAPPAHHSRENEAARATWSQLPRGFERNQRIEREGYEAASRDLSAAWETFGHLEDASERAGFLRGMFVAIAARAPREAITAIKKVANVDERNLAMETLANAWRGGVPASASSFARGELVHPSDAARLGLSLLNGTTGRAELALVWAEELVSEPGERAALWGAAAAAFTLKEPERVAAISASLPDAASREIFRDQFANALRFIAGDAAWSSAQSLPPGDLRNTAQSSILRAWSAADPGAAAAAATNLPDADDRTRAISVLAEAWGARDTEAAFAWAGTLEPDNRAAAEEAIRRSAPVGIGASIAMSEDGYPVVRELLPGGAAERAASLPAGTKIIALVDANGRTIQTHGMDLSRIVSQLRGERGTPVTMVVQAPDSGEQRSVTIVREQIMLKTAKK